VSLITGEQLYGIYGWFGHSVSFLEKADRKMTRLYTGYGAGKIH
jgi:hypothetical protein